MKRVIVLISALAAALMLQVAPALAQGAAAGQYELDENADTAVRGIITEISGSEVLVEEDPSDWGDPTGPPDSAPNSPKGYFTVIDETEILKQQGGEQTPATFEDLRVGQLVEAVYVGPVAASYPQQGEAGSSIILEEGGEDGPPGGATVTFELTVEGDIPEDRMLGVSTGFADAPEPVFCSTVTFHTDLPRCEDGGTYTDTFDLLSNGDTLSYEYYVMDYDYGGIVETFAADTITISDGQTISATYKADDNPDGEQVTLTGVIEKPESTTYQYGTHGISDWDSGYYALRSDTVDLDAYIEQKVNVYGTLVPGYENAQVEGGPPLVEVTRVVPTEEPGADNVTLSFELATEGPPPIETSFFGFIPAEGGISTQLTDPDGDGVYTGSMDVPQYAPGPRPVPEGTEPVTLPVQIVMSSEVKHGVPLYPNVIEDFGQVLMDEDKTFSASVVFEGPGKPVELGPPTPEPTTPDPTTPDSNGNGGSTSSPDGIEVLPDTGGALIPILGTIALLTGGGLLFVSLRLMGLLRRH